MRGRVLGKGCGRCREGGETDRTSVKDLEHWSTHRQCRPSARPIGRPWGRTTSPAHLRSQLCRHAGSPPSARHTLSARKTTATRSEEHTSELQSLMRISYAVFCWNKKKQTRHTEKTKRTNTASTI